MYSMGVVVVVVAVVIVVVVVMAIVVAVVDVIFVDVEVVDEGFVSVGVGSCRGRSVELVGVGSSVDSEALEVAWLELVLEAVVVVAAWS